ncbi:hypothetical protein J6590_011550 [Homalodisca vitripennis]|nr:hypothetical protein J6590_011550 [Homalodisca vitripennis]
MATPPHMSSNYFGTGCSSKDEHVYSSRDDRNSRQMAVMSPVMCVTVYTSARRLAPQIDTLEGGSCGRPLFRIAPSGVAVHSSSIIPLISHPRNRPSAGFMFPLNLVSPEPKCPTITLRDALSLGPDRQFVLHLCNHTAYYFVKLTENLLLR